MWNIRKFANYQRIQTYVCEFALGFFATWYVKYGIEQFMLNKVMRVGLLRPFQLKNTKNGL